MKRISRLTSLRWARITVHALAVPLLSAAAVAAAVSIGLDTAAPAAADTTSVSTPSRPFSTAQTGQLLQLQIHMNHGENSQYTKVANIMKTKHDTVKNSISNIR